MKKEQYEKQLFDRLIFSMRKNGLDKLVKSVIVTGSFGRDEATYSYRDEVLELKSDVEIGIVYKCRRKRISKFIQAVSADFCEELNCMPLTVRRIKRCHNFNKTIITPKYKTVFTYDLFNGSKILWGQDYLSRHEVTLKQIDMYEAKRIVANRIGELVYVREGDKEEELRWKNKLMLALGSAYLLCVGKYTCAYHGQYNIIEKCADEIDITLGEGFVDDYTASFSFLRRSKEPFDIDYEKLRQYSKNILIMFRISKISKPRVNSMSRKIKYMIKYIRSGQKKGLFRLEDRIIDTLISEFGENSANISATAKLWHDVLY